jgi:UDP-N-acetyl-D-mannosaminouronate:lipid I N-acetyl-D-mannosaminouronosyltransferase
MNSKYINNIKIFAPESKEQLIAFAFEKKQMLIAMNAEKILNSNDFEKKIMNENIAYPDGIGAVLSLKKKGLNKTVKIAGCELWLEIIKLKEKDKKFYLVGGKQEVIENTVNKLKLDFPCIDIVNYRNGYINSEEEIITLEKDILSKKPDVIFVAMGSPKQELLMQRLKNVYPAVYQGLGGSFDVYTGSVKRAPEWWVKNNLEWAYRLIKQPSRIKRQLPLFKFIFYTLFNKY